MSEQDILVGIDVGGTFTDCAALGADGSIATAKVVTTPEDESVGVINGLVELARGEANGFESYVGRIRRIVHGTTVATNAVVTESGVLTGLLTTEGFRDALQMRLGTKEEQYDNRYQGPQPFVSRARRIGIEERVDRHGRLVAPVKMEHVLAALRKFEQDGVEAVAVCLLHSYANPENELAVGRLLAERAPHLYVTLSSEVLPQIRFYDRLSTTVFNSYLGPIVQRYVRRLLNGLKGIEFAGQLLIMQSNGGVVSPETAILRAAGAVASGPAAGPLAGAAHVEALGYRDCITVDMGGTSFDVSIVVDGSPVVVPDAELDGRVLALPTIESHAIGAGGGSIGWIDEGGLLRMGPNSAGAKPGPACYGFGGDLPTCTDADLALGYINPDFFLGGQLRLTGEAAVAAIDRHVAAPSGLDVSEAAAGMYRVINVNMAAGVRRISINNGIDPRTMPLVVAGGAGPVHAGAIAEDLGIPVVIVPRLASVLCAAGMLLTDLQHDYIHTHLVRLQDADRDPLLDAFDAMVTRGRTALTADGLDGDRIQLQLALDLRYVGQHREITVNVVREEIETEARHRIIERFHEAHERDYGHWLPGEQIEVVNLRVTARGVPDKLELPVVTYAGPESTPAPKTRREAYRHDARRFEEFAVYDGSALTGGHRFPGPAIVEETTTTVVVPAGYDLICDLHGSYVLAHRQIADTIAARVFHQAVDQGRLGASAR